VQLLSRPTIVREMATRWTQCTLGSEADTKSTDMTLTTLMLYFEWGRTTNCSAHQLHSQQCLASFTQQHLSRVKMAPKNNKGKAKEPEKAGAAKVKGGQCFGCRLLHPHVDHSIIQPRVSMSATFYARSTQRRKRRLPN
jgi:hypothetical protein